MRQLTIVVAAIGSATLLAGCATAQGAGTPRPTSPSSTAPGATAPPAAAARPRACGWAITHGLSARTQVLEESKGSLTCFTEAAKACKPATITVENMGVDTGTRFQFTINAGGKPASCAVTETSQFYGVVTLPKKQPVYVTHGQVAAVTRTGVLLSYGRQHVLIPSVVTTFPAA
jgi:hypothetical protein